MKKYLLTFIAVGVLMFGGKQTTVYAEGSSDAGSDYEEQQNDLEDVQDQELPLAVLSGELETGGFVWGEFIMGFLAASIVETGILAVYMSRKEKVKQE